MMLGTRRGWGWIDGSRELRRAGVERCAYSSGKVVRVIQYHYHDVVRQERKTYVVQSPLKSILAQSNANLLSRFKCAEHRFLAQLRLKLDIVNSSEPMTLDEFDLPDLSILGGDSTDIRRLSSSLWEENSIVKYEL